MSRTPANVAEFALIGGIAFAVVTFGGTNVFLFSLVEILFFAIAAWLTLKPSVIRGDLRPIHFAVPIALVSVVLLQLIPFPAAVVGAIRGATNGGDPPSRVLSIVPYETRSELLVLLACVIAFILSVLTATERSRKLILIRWLVGLGAAEAFYGLTQYLTNSQAILWYPKKYDLFEATGTYVNRNHFAGLLEMVLPFAVCLTFYEAEKMGSHRRRSRRPQGLGKNFPALALWLGVAIVLMAALVLSRSRMGLLSAASSLVIVIGLMAMTRKGAPLAAAVVFLILSCSFAAWIGVRPAFMRFEGVGQEFSGPESRLSIWPGAVELIRAHPLLGTGLGTFPIAYTAVQSTFLTQFVNHAHNDYLELASDIGIPAAAMLFLSMIGVAGHALRRFLKVSSRFERYVALASVGSIAAILLHSLADFNLYIPANALVFAAVLGIAVAPVAEANPEILA